jgi:8-oxo-dGTP pyrophosphatase MutT (NUDIX family)
MSRYNKKLYCNNCNKSGHYYSNCKEPIVSYGIICINVVNDKLLDELKINKKDINYNGVEDIHNFYLLKSNIKFLMVQRRYTLGYIEFIRGRYNVENVDGVGALFEQMIQDEIDKIASSNYDQLWLEFWGPKQKKNSEYYIAKGKFDNLINGIPFSINFYTSNIKPKYKSLEWGFPKGRKLNNNSEIPEDDLTCALREFHEETGIDANKLRILDNIKPFVETFIGTNGKTYRHVYFIGLLELEDINNVELLVGNSEIYKLGWFNYDEAINMIRPYYTTRKNILTELFINIMNVLMK